MSGGSVSAETFPEKLEWYRAFCVAVEERYGGSKVRTKRTVEVSCPPMEYIVRVTTLVPVDRHDMCEEIVANVYGPVTAEVLSYKAIEDKP